MKKCVDTGKKCMLNGGSLNFATSQPLGDNIS